jgi:hypothetical protein
MNGNGNAERATGLESSDGGESVADVGGLGLEGAVDRATDLLDQAARQGFADAQSFYALFNAARDVLKAAREA